MDRWWTEIDDEILGGLAGNGAMAPAELGLRLGLSEGATTSILSMLAQEGKVRICLVELSLGRGAAQALEDGLGPTMVACPRS